MESRARTARPLIGFVGVWGAVVAHHLRFWTWTIEDAAISFAYARHVAMGMGPVAWFGGDVVEGYSNPTWVGCLTLAELLGVPAYTASRWLELLFVLALGVSVYGLTRELEEDEPLLPMITGGLLATSSVAAIWSSSGLENSLFVWLWTTAAWRLAVEVRRGGAPLSAILWALVATSRPEAPVYAALGALTLAVGTRDIDRCRRWVVAFLVPFSLYHGWRYTWFGYAFPMTYYAKLSESSRWWFTTDTRGWAYLSDFFSEHGRGVWWVGVVFGGLLGTSQRRWRVGSVLVAFFGCWLIVPQLLLNTVWQVGPIEFVPLVRAVDLPDFWLDSRPVGFLFGGAALLAMTVGSGPRWPIRGLLVAQVLAGLGFALHADGDWMRGHRWVSLFQLPMAILCASALSYASRRLGERVARIERSTPALGWWDAGLSGLMVSIALSVAASTVLTVEPWVFLGGVAVASWLMLIASSIGRSWVGVVSVGIVVAYVGMFELRVSDAFARRPETSPESIYPRVAYKRWVADRVDRVLPMIDLDVDQGAHLWWGIGDLWMMDLAGLVDVPLAQHRFRRDFLYDYVLRERRPHLAHVHGGWAKSAALDKDVGWSKDYHELPPYDAGDGGILHPGNFLRRDMVFSADWIDGTLDIALEEDWILERFAFAEPAVRGENGWLQMAVRSQRRPRGRALPEVWVVAHRGREVAATWRVELAHGWFSPIDWRPGEAFVGGVAVPVQLPEGAYELTVVFQSPSGAVLSRRAGPEPLSAPVFAEGEVSLPSSLVVLDGDERDRRVVEIEASVAARAAAGACVEAEDSWDRARWLHGGDPAYRKRVRWTIGRVIAECWADRSSIEAIERARMWDPTSPTLRARVPTLSEPFCLWGRQFASEGRWSDAFVALDRCARFDPSRSWARRDAEVARRQMLDTSVQTLPEP